MADLQDVVPQPPATRRDRSVEARRQARLKRDSREGRIIDKLNRGVSMAQVALAWVLKNPVVTAPIVGPTKPHHLADAVAALDIQLTEDEIRALEEHYTPRLPTYF